MTNENTNKQGFNRKISFGISLIIFYFLWKSLDFFLLSGAIFILSESSTGHVEISVLTDVVGHLKIVAAVISILSAITASRLLTHRVTTSILLAIIVVWLGGPIEAIINASIISTRLEHFRLLSTSVIGPLLSTVIWPALITWYLLASKRVADIYYWDKQ